MGEVNLDFLQRQNYQLRKTVEEWRHELIRRDVEEARRADEAAAREAADPAIRRARELDEFVEAQLADADSMEGFRRSAWLDQPDAYDRIAEGLEPWREGWPEGVEPRTYARRTCEQLFGSASAAEPEPARTRLHEMLDADEVEEARE